METATKKETKMAYFKSKSAGHKLSGFKQEIRKGDRVVQADMAIEFVGGNFVTDDPDKIAFIEKSKPFTDGSEFITREA